MPKFTRKKMCSECPFRAIAPCGWLGPHTPDHMNQVAHSDAGFICHTSVKQMQDCGKSGDDIADKGQQCVGMSRYRISVSKWPRDLGQSDFQRSLELVEDQPTIAPFKFLEYHKQSLLKKGDYAKVKTAR